MQPTRAQQGIPTVSVIMANYRGGATLARALESVLTQTMANLEIIVADDASPDDSVSVVTSIMARDERVRLVASPQNGGPARTRNLALAQARGEWIAIVDSDDIVHPERLERLLAAAAQFKADIVADDLLHFHEDGSPPTLLLGNHDTPFPVSAEAWVTAGMDGKLPALGYLKPLIRAEALGLLRYDETLRIGEDYDLLLRTLLAGASMWIVPEPWYLYRRHSGSISHRLSAGDVEAMLANQVQLLAAIKPDAGLAQAFAQRRDALQGALDFGRLVEAIKARSPGATLNIIARRPALLARLWTSFTEGRRRRTAKPHGAANTGLLNLDKHASLPAYVPSQEVDWTRFRRDPAWLAVAAQGVNAHQIIAKDAAARYAAGFIPAAAAPTPIRNQFATNAPAVAT
ncbi:Glycosyl transferase, family 2 [Devosia sp. LC5]|uniref:glycosyltransferase family 2 protein n=1 Tax=Devosia sp. LC5 TaxID=1502724 RepID=UPI0004E3568F|nr:glycosyltransferase [Devosia sp. LC5]KFC62804.1 Glycosyl transferase, family 2 [Devosia sp. LC5]